MVSDMEVHMKERCVTEFLHVVEMALIDIHWHFLNLDGDQTVDLSEVVSGVLHFSSGDSGSHPLVQIAYYAPNSLLVMPGKNA